MKKMAFLVALLLAVTFAVVGYAEKGTDPGAILLGDIITFGQYEQDNDPDNGPEPIEWMVLDVQDGKALLLSRYGLDAIPYNTEFVDITWEDCTLRAWLNDEFLNTAFTETDQAAIVLTEVDNSDEQGASAWDTKGGNNTWDRIFLLSNQEGNKKLYPLGDDYINCELTPYATVRGSLEMSGTLYPFTRNWWLRSPGETQRDAEYSACDGWVRGCYGVAEEKVAVRPALWLDKEKVTITGSQISAVADDALMTGNTPDQTDEADTTVINRLYAQAKKFDRVNSEMYIRGKSAVIAIYDSDVSEAPYIIASGTECEYAFPGEHLADSVKDAEIAILIYPKYVQVGNYNDLFDTYGTYTYLCVIDPYTGKLLEKMVVKEFAMPPEQVSGPDEAYGGMYIQEALDYAAWLLSD